MLEKMTDEFSKVLTETDEQFQKVYNMGVVGRDIESVLSDSNVFEAYMENLTQDFDENQKEDLHTIMDNTRSDILQESSLGNIQPFSSLTMPMIVKLWARLVMTQAIPTQPVSTPQFTVSWIKPYIMGHDGNKYYLPDSINEMPVGELTGVRQLKEVIDGDTVTDGKIVGYDLFTGISSADRSKEDSVDRKFTVIAGKWSDSFDMETEKAGEWVPFHNDTIIKMDTSDNLYGEITYPISATETATDSIQGHVDVAKGYLTVVSLSGKLTGIKIRGYVSSEQHTWATQESFEVANKQIAIGTAEHLESTFPVEWLQDLQAMYNVDGTASIVDQMSRTVQQRVDMSIIDFLNNSYADTGARYHKTFDVYPNSNYALSPTEWQKQLRTLVDYITQEMRQDFKSYDATFTVVGNPLDINLLSDINWTFQSTASAVGGVGVNYSIGAVSGVASYKVLSSDLIPEGTLKVIGLPQRPDYLTYKYYPYSFNIVNNYNNSINQALPNLMMTKRYTLEQFTPIIGQIDIEHNDGSVWNQ